MNKNKQNESSPKIKIGPNLYETLPNTAPRTTPNQSNDLACIQSLANSKKTETDDDDRGNLHGLHCLSHKIIPLEHKINELHNNQQNTPNIIKQKN